MSRATCFSWALILWNLCLPVRADLFMLSNGGQVEGELLNPEQSPRETYLVKSRVGGQLTLSASEVERWVAQSEAERRYEEALPTIRDTEQGHWEMAEKCGVAKLTEQREFHLEQVLRHNSEHVEARRALGYNRVDGRWQRQDDFMSEQGFVRHRSAWRLPQELVLEQRARDQEAELVEWRKNVKLWREWVIKGRGRAAEGQANLQAIRDPRAAEALATLLKQNNEPVALKLLYVEILAQFGDHGTAIGALTRTALQDSEQRVREKALDALAASGSRVATQMFIKMLGDNDNKVVQRAGVALGWMKQPDMSTLPLIEALISEHKYTVGGGGMQPSFGSGGGGLSMGGKPKIVKEKVKNESVLHALTTIHQGVNFGFDQDAWRKWHIQKHTPQKVDLRRGD